MAYSQDDPIACTLRPELVRYRLDEWQRVLDDVVERTPVDGGLRLRFGTTPAPIVADLASREKACCSFFEFAVESDGQGVSLEVRAPVEARELVHQLFGPTC
jgi:hypothetical protein